MTSPSSVCRPFVVMLGWLGCQPKNLRRYESLYNGFEVLSRIATPTQVVRAILTQPSTTPPQSSRTWPYEHTSSSIPGLAGQVKTIDDLAWEILAEMDASDAPVFFLHLFSNGGGLVWEALARIFAASHTFPGPVCQRIRSIEVRIAGIIVDSAPSLDLNRLADALAWVPLRDRLQMLLQAHPSWFYLWWKWNTPTARNFLNQRRATYLETWTSNPVTVRVPLLFLYCTNDPLAESGAIGEIVKQLPNAKSICWKDSLHCGHLLRHGEEYTGAVNTFVRTHLERPDNPSRSRL